MSDCEFFITDSKGTMLGDANGKFVTDSMGTIPNSTVVVVESKAPSNYVLDPTPRTIIVRNGSNSVSTGTTSSGSPTVGGSGDSGTDGNNITVENVPKVTLTIEKYLETESGEKPLKIDVFQVMPNKEQDKKRYFSG